MLDPTLAVISRRTQANTPIVFLFARRGDAPSLLHSLKASLRQVCFTLITYVVNPHHESRFMHLRLRHLTRFLVAV